VVPKTRLRAPITISQRGTKDEHSVWTTTASLSILSLWSVSPAASARGPALIGWRASPQNLDPRLPCDLTDRFSYDCLWRAEARPKAGKSACGVYLPDLANPRPPDLPPGLLKLRLIKSA
jgi:hypothetical protein